MKNSLFTQTKLLGLALLAGAQLAAAGPLELYYTSAATFTSGVTSQQAVPIGNGKLAAMVYGGVAKETLQFNEDTVWAGTVHDYTRPGASAYLDDIRAKVWQGEGAAAYSSYAAANFMSSPIRQSPYVGAGVFEISTGHSSPTQYRRSLDLETATAQVSYVAGGVTYTRETFASYPDRVIVMKYAASQPGKVSLSLGFTSLHTDRQVTVEGGHLVMNARVNKDANANRQQVSGIRFQARAEVRAEGGTVSGSGSSITVTGADSVVLVLHVASNFVRYNDISADPDARAKAALEAVAGKSYDDLRAAHVADYQELFNRVELDLGTSADAGLPTDQRLAKLKAKLDVTVLKDAQKNSQIGTWTSNFTLTDPQLLALNFQMARYLMIAGSRPGSQPMNLQGKWSNELDPSWESKMTLNINQEMNYWGAEAANLGETHVPMVDLVKDLSESGALAAQNHYNAGGWMVHHNTDLWRGAAPINNPGGLWPSGGAWLSMHVWWHFQYNGDLAYLGEIYPLMKGAAQFFVDFLVMDPRKPTDQYAAWGNAGHPQWGQYLLTNPSHSPEQANKKLGDNGELVAGTMMDNQLIRALFSYVIEAGGILGVDAAFRDTLAEKRALLPPNMIGKHGQLQEWLEDVDVPENPVIGGHRHMSHLLDLFPGEGIHPVHEPAFAEAVRVVLDWKGDPSNNTSWSRAWKMNLRAALGQGDHAFMILQDVIGRSHTANMTFSNKGNTEDQVDGNLGVLMGTAQFFLQSRRGETELLPALPTHLHTGSVSGLRAKDGFEVGITWAEGQLVEASIRSDLGHPCALRTPEPVAVVDRATGNLVESTLSDTGLCVFPTEIGGEYRVLPADAVPTWLGFPIRPDGNVDTGDFLGWAYAASAPYVWSYSLNNWMFADEALIDPASGGWIFVYNFN